MSGHTPGFVTSALPFGGGEEPLAHPFSDWHSGAFGGVPNGHVIICGQPHRSVDRLGVVAFGSAGSRIHRANYSDTKKSLTTATYATRISRMEATQNLTEQTIETLKRGDCIVFRKTGSRKWSMAVNVLHTSSRYGLVKVEYATGRTRLLSTSSGKFEIAVWYRS